MEGCINGIVYLYRHNIKHRRIKPDNILLHLTGSNHDWFIGRPQIQPKITDLGTANIIYPATPQISHAQLISILHRNRSPASRVRQSQMYFPWVVAQL
jgi:serine/threonine protein kinase